MASSKPLATPDRHVMPALAATNAGFMPADAIYEILLRVPAKDLCRFRAVCWPWRSLLSDPHFMAAHAAHHPGPLIIAGYHPANQSRGILCDVMDLSGRVVKRVRHRTCNEIEWVMFIQQDLICTTKGYRSLSLLNPANGAVYVLPGGFAEEHKQRDFCHYMVVRIVFGLVASTGEYKVLRLLGWLFYEQQLCEVLTLDGSIRSGWRAKKGPPGHLSVESTVVINGIVYFFSTEVPPDLDDAPKYIDSFDLETEQWRVTIQGPQIDLVGDAVDTLDNQACYPDCTLASLNANLVVVHCHDSSMDLWFLIDFEKSLWVKQHSIQVNSNVQHVHPLLVLDDGRIFTYIEARRLLRIYNPRTSTYTDVAEIGSRIEIGLYTGNLLSLATDANY